MKRGTNETAREEPEDNANDAPEGDPNFVLSLARGLSVILAFSSTGRAATVAEISRVTGLSRAAVRRLLLTLERLGYVRSEGRIFRLQPKTLALGQAYIASNPLIASAQELLDWVAGEVRESCSLAVLDEGYVTFIGRSSGRRLVSANLTVGARLPAYCTSLGRVLLAALPPDELDDYFRRTPLERHTPKTEINEKKLRRILEEVRETGYSITDSELEVGLTSIAVPVEGSNGRAEAALGVAAIRYPLGELRRKVLPILQKASRQLSLRLSY